MILISKKQRMWQIIGVQLLGVIALTFYYVIGVIPSLIGSIYAGIGLRNLVATQVDFSSTDLVDATDINFEQAYSYDWSPSSAGTYLKLAEAFMRRNNSVAAISALEKAYLRQPDRTQVLGALALAYEANGRFNRADDLWARVGTTAEQMFKAGDDYLEQFDYRQARVWYASALRKTVAPTAKQLFKSSLVDLRTGGHNATELLGQLQQIDNTFVVYTLDRPIRIEGGDLRWTRTVTDTLIDYGVPLSQSFPHGITSSGFLWVGGETLAVLFVKAGGNYDVSAKVRPIGPRPVDIAVGIDGQTRQTFSLAGMDDNWETVAINVALSSGFHTLEVWFLNPKAIIGGEDRKAEVQSIMIESDK